MRKLFLCLMVSFFQQSLCLAESYHMQSSDQDLQVLAPTSDVTVSLLNNSYTYGRTITIVNKGSALVYIKDTSASPSTIKVVASGASAGVACTAALCSSASDWSPVNSAWADDSGTVTGTISSPFGTAPNLTISYRRVGQVTTLAVPAIYVGCSVATGTATFSATLPTSLRPAAVVRNVAVVIQDASTFANTPGVVELQTAGSFKIFKTPLLNATAWTTSGSCCWEAFSVTYNN